MFDLKDGLCTSRQAAIILPLTIGATVQAAKLRAEKIGIGVSPEGQKLFDALAKTMDCRWNDKDIVCMDAVSLLALH